MRIAIISDTHFGDPMCTLVSYDRNGSPILGPRYREFVRAAGPSVDYLILLGDIFDFSIKSYGEAYQAAKVFFVQLARDGLVRQSMLYVPGNHDFDMWTMVEYAVNIVYHVTNRKPPETFKMSVPAVIDDCSGSPTRGFHLPGVSKRTDSDRYEYGGLFLDHIAEPEAEEINFVFAYPNVYLVTDHDSVLITHGHYLEAFWAMGREWALEILGDDLLQHIQPDARTLATAHLEDLVAINFPLCQFACSGVGQAGPLTKVVQQIQRDAKEKQLGRVRQYLDRLDNKIDKLLDYRWYDPRELASDLVCNRAKKEALKTLEAARDTRYNAEFVKKLEVKERFFHFYAASVRETRDLGSKHGLKIPEPKTVLFGHTHVPVPWGDPAAPRAKHSTFTENAEITLFNTGGWLNRKTPAGQLEFCGAEVVTYETGVGFRSVSIR